MSMRDDYTNKVSFVQGSNLLSAAVGKEMWQYPEMGKVTQIEIIDEDYRPLHAKIITESGKIVRLFSIDRTIESEAIK